MIKDLLKDVPELYSQDGKGIKADVYLVLEGINGWKWYITEYNEKDNLAFGYVKGFENEWGYIDIEEIQNNINKGYIYIKSQEIKQLKENI